MLIGWPEDVSGAGGEPERRRWIIELESSPVLRWAAGNGGIPDVRAKPSVWSVDSLESDHSGIRTQLNKLARERSEFLARASAQLDRELAPLAVLRHLRHGMVLELTGREARLIRGLAGISSIEPDHVEPLALRAGTELTGARASHSGLIGLPQGRGEGTVIGIIDTGIDWNHRAFDEGVGRWVFVLARATSTDIGDDLEVSDFRGFCPGCPSFAMSFDGNSDAVGQAQDAPHELRHPDQKHCVPALCSGHRVDVQSSSRRAHEAATRLTPACTG
ncbi:MAG: hypothetical protein V2J10_09780 [Wenzhouxiangella sp.]|jgi:hypothetical protein|nr:hypothetical protein [Wenzhouxiangella sp.]